MREHSVLPETSQRMRRIRQSNTAPELVVRQALRRLGISYRTCVKQLPGTPDIANRRRHWAVFVHGCYWHGHRGCRLYTVPKTNTVFWVEKIAANRARDNRKARALRRAGFHVVTVWQCETKNFDRLMHKLDRALAGLGTPNEQ